MDTLAKKMESILEREDLSTDERLKALGMPRNVIDNSKRQQNTTSLVIILIATLAKRRKSRKIYHHFKNDFFDKRTLDHNKIYTPNERKNQRTQVVYFFKLQHCLLAET
jgi:hypothetical protein